MKLKKIFMCAVVALIGTALFAAGLKPNEGYMKLKWGTSTDDAKKAGYKLTEPDAADKEAVKQGYSDGVSAYYVTSKDKAPSSLHFYYYMGRLFQVTEMLPANQSSRDKLEKRYGKFSEIGVFELGEQYAAVEVTKNGEVSAWWLVISKNPNGNGVIVNFFDWNIFKNVSELGKQLAGNDSNAGNSFVGELSDLAEKLVQDGSGKPTYAFLALTSDDGNALVENYVTDALTEAMFNTGKIKIVERASIEKILSEQQFQDSALVNENTASEIGNLTGANYVCYGTVKDLGNQVTLNVKVVEVSTAELCSMGCETVAKDEYLSGVGFEARKTGGIAKKGNLSSNTKTVKHVENNLWEVTTERNDFDEYTLYYFCNKGNRSDKYQLRVFYYKYDNPSKSTVWGGVRWGGSWEEGNYDFKIDSGEIITYNLPSEYSTKMSGQNYGYETGKNGACRFLIEMFKNNEILSIKRKDMAVKFQSAGLEEKMNENGITWEEIDTALSNLEF